MLLLNTFVSWLFTSDVYAGEYQMWKCNISQPRLLSQAQLAKQMALRSSFKDCSTCLRHLCGIALASSRPHSATRNPIPAPKTDFKAAPFVKHTSPYRGNYARRYECFPIGGTGLLSSTTVEPLRECKCYRSTSIPRMQKDRDAVGSGTSIFDSATVGTAQPKYAPLQPYL